MTLSVNKLINILTYTKENIQIYIFIKHTEIHTQKTNKEITITPK